MKKFFLVAFLVVTILFGSCRKGLKDGVYSMELYSQNDLHGRFFDSLYDGTKENSASLANISQYVKERRTKIGAENLLLIDVGDNLQGDNAAFFFNYIYNYEKDVDRRHLFTKILEYLDYDAVIVGNHDIETGHSVYDRINLETDVPYLAANAIDEKSGRSYFEPYTIVNKNGIKVAVIGMTNSNIKKWLGEKLWEGIDFVPIRSIVDTLVNEVRSKENPDLVVLAIHAGIGDDQGSNIENPAIFLAKNTKGIDIILSAHDHQKYCNKFWNGEDSVLVIEGGSRANWLSGVKIDLTINDGRVVKKEVAGELINMSKVGKDEEYLKLFRPEFEQIKKFSTEKIGVLNKDIYTRDAYFGCSDYINFLHKIQLGASQADISVAAPLTYDGVIKAGDINYNSLFIIYPFENELYKLSLQGKEIKNYLEYSYNNWVNTAHSNRDNILKIKFNENTKKYSFEGIYYNFDAAGGLEYIVDVSKPFGKRVKIVKLLNGKKFSENEQYTVAFTSYRANGGGDLLEKGAGISPDKFEDRIIEKFKDIRSLIYDYFSSGKELDLQNVANWKFIPEKLVNKGIKRDSLLLFSER